MKHLIHRNPEPKEQRKFYRINISFLVDYEVVSEKEISPENKSVAKDLSKTGLSLDLPGIFQKIPF